jgi:hypothetical protein
MLYISIHELNIKKNYQGSTDLLKCIDISREIIFETRYLKFKSNFIEIA